MTTAFTLCCGSPPSPSPPPFGRSIVRPEEPCLPYPLFVTSFHIALNAGLFSLWSVRRTALHVLSPFRTLRHFRANFPFGRPGPGFVRLIRGSPGTNAPGFFFRVESPEDADCVRARPTTDFRCFFSDDFRAAFPLCDFVTNSVRISECSRRQLSECCDTGRT